MDKLCKLTNIHATRNEITQHLVSRPFDEMLGLRACIFEEARAKELTDPMDIPVNRISTSTRPKNFAVAEDIFTLSDCHSKQEKNSKNTGKEWQTWNKRATIMEEI